MSNVRLHMKPLLLRLTQAAREVLLLVVGLRMKPPLLQLTEAARAKLVLDMSEITQFEPVATVLWAATSKTGTSASGEASLQLNEPQWGVGFYDRATQPSGRIT